MPSSNAELHPPLTSPALLDRYRSYLVLLARWHWNPRWQGQVDPSDVAQQALVQAWQGLKDYRGQSEGELRGWLRRIVSRCLADLARNLARDKRDLAREQSLDAAVAESSVRLERWLDDQHSSPQQRAERNEQIVRLAEALAALPEPQQEAVTLHHLHGLKVAEIAARMNRSSTAVAGLLKRGLQALREQLTPGE